MKIKRTVNGQEIEFELTSAELVEAHDEFVTNFMYDVMLNDFNVKDESRARNLAERAYDLYCKGIGFTEYECCESVYDKFGDDDDDSFLDDLHREQMEQL